MSAELEVRVRQLRQQIAATEAAPPPAADQLAAELAKFDAATAAFQAAPYRPRTWSPVPPSWALIESALMGMAGALIPGAREHFEQHHAAKLAAGGGLSEADKQARLQVLTSELRQAEAVLELDRRRQEQQRGEVLPRADADPGIWLLPDAELAAIAGRAA